MTQVTRRRQDRLEACRTRGKRLYRSRESYQRPRDRASGAEQWRTARSTSTMSRAGESARVLRNGRLSHSAFHVLPFPGCSYGCCSVLSLRGDRIGGAFACTRITSTLVPRTTSTLVLAPALALALSQAVLGRRKITVCTILPDYRLNLTNVIVAAASGLSDFQTQARTKALMEKH
jgi:hypothetical protein